MMLANVVLPTPGGPQKMMEGIRPESIILRNTAPLPTRWVWPINSSRFRGRNLSANGMDILSPRLFICTNVHKKPNKSVVRREKSDQDLSAILHAGSHLLNRS